MKYLLSKVNYYKSVLKYIFLIGFVSSFPILAKSDPITDPSAPLSQQPTVKLDGTGIPKINITTPKAGVSHNKFKQFNVSPNGLILNNSKIGGTSRIGGAVVGNPNLKDSGSANVIINEVTGDTDSQLKGAIEVFGTRADVILANPNGVICNGCAFLNTGRATLTTGRPVVNGAQVDLHVTEGVVVVEGDGLSAPDGDAALVGRHVIIDGPVNVRDEAYVSGGTQYHDHNQRKSRAAPVVNGRDVLFSVDASELGAMSAGQIRIHGNEAGLGVRAYGDLNSAGDIKIESAGDVVYRNANAAGKGIIRSNSDVTQYGNAIFGDTVSIAAGSYLLSLNAKLRSEKDVEINTDGLTQIEGEVSGDNIRIEARGGLKNSGFIMADGDLEIISGEGLTNFRRKLGIYDVTYENRYARYRQWFKYSYWRRYRWWRWWRWHKITRWYTRWVTRFVERVEHRNLVEEHVANGGTLSGRNVNITAESDLSNTGAVITATQDLTINALGDVSNSYIMLIKQHEGGKHKEFHPGEILAGRNLTITGEGDLSNQASHIGAFGNVVIDVKGDVTNYLTADKYVTKEHERLANSTKNTSGSSYSERHYRWWWLTFKNRQTHSWNTTSWLEQDREDENLMLNPGRIVSLAGDLSLKANSYSALGSELSAGNNLTLDVNENISLVQVVDTEKHKVTTTTNSITNHQRSNLWGYSYRWWGGYTRWYWGRHHRWTTHSRSQQVENNDKTIVAASNLFGKNITIKAESIYAPGAKIAAEEDLSVLTTGSLFLEGDTPKDTSSATGLNVAEITHYNEWDYVDFSEDVPDFNVQDLGSDKVASINDGGETQDAYQAFTHSKELLRALYVLSQLSSGHEISDAAKAVGVQEWKTATSEKGFEYTLREGLVEGEKNFSVALLNRFDAATNSPSRLASDSNLIEKMAWRFVSEQAIDDIAESPYTVLHAKNITIGSDEDVSLLGGTLIDAVQDLKIVAGRDVLLAPVRGGVKGAVDAIATKYKSEGLWKLSPVSIGAGRDLSIVAGDDVYNIGGSLWADDSIVINAAGDIQNVGVRSNFKLTSAHGCGYSACGRTGYRFTPADMVAKGSILLTAGGSILNNAADIITDGSIYLQAGEDITNEAKTGKFTHVDYYRRWVKRKWYGKKTVYTIRRYAQTPVVRGAAIEAKGGDLILSAGRDLMNFGGLIEADGLLSASVGRDVLLNSKSVELITINHSSKSSSWLGWNYAGKLNSAEYNNFRGAYSVLRGDTVNIAASGDLVARGARIQSQGDLTIAIDGNIAILPLQNTLYRNIKTEKKGFFSEKRNHTYRSNTVTNRTNIGSGSDLLISSANKNIVIQAANLTAGGDLSLDASRGQIALLTAKEREVEQIERYKANAVWWVAEQEGFIRENVIHNHIKAGGQIYFRANNGLLVEYEDKGDINHAIAELSKAPELAWMAQLRIRNDVEWRGVRPHYEEWYEKQEGLTEGAAAVISLAVAAVTGPLGSQFFLGAQAGTQLGVGSTLLGFGSKTAVTAAIDAGFTAIASRAAVSLINNKGDIGAVLKELGSSESLRSIAASIITAGVTHGLDAGFYDGAKGLYEQVGLPANTNIPQTFEHLHTNLINNAVRGTVAATIRTAIEGGDIGDAVLSSLQSVGVNTVLSSVHTSIGDLTDGTGANDLPLANIIAHTVAGGLAAEALGENFASGATAAFASAVAANAGVFDNLFLDDDKDVRREKIAAIGQLIGGAASFLMTSGRDAGAVNQGASIAESAVLHNYLYHREALERSRAQKACSGGDLNACKEVDRLNNLDIERDLALKAACSTSVSSNCLVQTSLLISALGSYHKESTGTYSSQAEYLNEVGDAADDLAKEYAQYIPFLRAIEKHPEVSSLLAVYNHKVYTENTGLILRSLNGLVNASADSIKGVHSLVYQIAHNPEALKATIDAIKENPELLIDGIKKPYKERIAAGDYAGAVGYAVPALIELAYGTKGVVSGGKAVASAAAKVNFATLQTVITKAIRNTCSFHGDTLVQTNFGFTPIKSLRLDKHKVWSRNPDTGEMGYKALVAQYSNPYKETVRVRIRDQKTGVEQTIVSNRIHPYFVTRPEHMPAVKLVASHGHDYKGPIEGGEWVNAEHLKAGFKLLNGNESWSEVVSVKIEKKPLKAYNLTVEDYHTYFVKGAANDNAQPVWVHNDCFDKVNFNINRLPEVRQNAVNDTLSHINSDVRPDWIPANRRNKWGSDFRNNKADLPKKDANGEKITYKEYDVQNTSGNGAGAERIVKGSDGRVYYTGTHYGDDPGKPFVRIK